MEKKDTYGNILLSRQAQNITMEDDVIEYRRSMEPEIIAGIHNTIDQAKKAPLYANKNFYVVMLVRKERFGDQPNYILLARRSCPTPVYKQSVWKYHHVSGELEFLWSIPDVVLYYHIVNNSQKYLQDKETVNLAKMVLLMESGELLQWVKKENDDKPDAVIINKEIEC